MTRYIDDAPGAVSGSSRSAATLQVAPSTYYAAKQRPPSARALSDAALKPSCPACTRTTTGSTASSKLWRQLLREGIHVGRDRVARLMRELGIAGVVRGKREAHHDARRRWPRGPVIWSSGSSRAGTQPALGRRSDLRCAPGRDSPTPPSSSTPSAGASWAGGCSTSLRTDLALDALEMAIWARAGRLDRPGPPLRSRRASTCRDSLHRAPRRRGRRRLGRIAAATATTTPSPKRSTACTRPS